MRYKYSQHYDAQKTSRAQAFDADVSYKDLTQVCGAIRGKTIPKARRALEGAIEGSYPISYRSHNTGMGHRSQLGGRKGRFPRKAAKLVSGLLDNAFSNAQSKGLDEKDLVVLQASAYKQNVYPRHRKYFASGNVLGYGKFAMFSNYMTAWLELVLGPAKLAPLPVPTKKSLAAAKKAKTAKAAKPAPAAKKEEKPAKKK